MFHYSIHFLTVYYGYQRRYYQDWKCVFDLMEIPNSSENTIGDYKILPIISCPFRITVRISVGRFVFSVWKKSTICSSSSSLCLLFFINLPCFFTPTPRLLCLCFTLKACQTNLFQQKTSFSKDGKHAISLFTEFLT